MANKGMFQTTRGRQTPPATTKNAAGGLAYSFTPEHQIAQLAFTGTFNKTYYQSGQAQLDALRDAADKVSPEFLAKAAVAARTQGYMKDMPAAIAAILSKADIVLLDKIFDRVIDNGKMLRNFVQMVRSGQFGRKSLGSGPKRLVRRWLASKSDYAIFRASVGNDPSLADVIKMVHPKDERISRQALYGHLIGRNRHGFEALPEIVQQFEAWKRGEGTGEVPNVDFRMLTALPLTGEQWAQIARRGGWHMVRMNLNTFARHGVFDIPGMEDEIAAKLQNAEQIRNSKVFPYQLLAAYLNTGPDRPVAGYFGYYDSRARAKATEKPLAIPSRVRLALQDALEIAVENVPAFEGRVAVVVDTSGSMSQAVTGYRQGATSKVRCVDVAALVGATVMRKNPLAVVIPVDIQVHPTNSINPRDSIMTNAERLARFGGGGTDLSAAMRFIATSKAAPDLIIMVSDNESWVDSQHRGWHRGTGTMEIFNQLQSRNPNLKMVNIDIVANTTSQTVGSNPAILEIGGFSDQIWTTIDRFVRGVGPDEWVQEIKAIDLDTPSEAES